jgi:tetratricopeptide (TPR) repeat protein
MKIAMRNWLSLIALALVSGVLPAYAQPPQDDEFARAQKIVEQVRAGQTTIEKAFDEGSLSRRVLLAIISTEKALDPGRGFWSPGEETYRWTGFLIKKYPEIFDEKMFLGYTARIRIALYFLSQNDARGETMMTQIIDEQPRENPDMTILMSALTNLSSHYSAKGETKKAVETALAIREFETPPAKQAIMFLMAARAARDGGDKENAFKLYEQIPEFGYGWATGHARSDMAEILMQGGQLEAARALLKKPLEGLYGDQLQVILSGRLAQSYFQTGQWNEAHQWAKTTVAQYEALGAPPMSVGIGYAYEDAKRLSAEIDRVQSTPVELLTKQINVQMPKNATQPIRTFFTVRSYRAVTPKISSDDPAIQGWLFRQSPGADGNLKMIGLAIGPEILQREGKAEITVSFAEFPDVTLHIPVTVTVVK